MEVMYQRRCANYIYQVPEGLRELMSDISREVLRHQPKEIYSFIADYLEALMVTRENARVAAKTISNIAEASEVISELVRRTNMTPAQANKAILVIQKAFRKHLRHKETQHEPIEEVPLLEKICKKCKISMKTAENSVVIIQRAYRQFRLRREQELKTGTIDWKTAFFSTMKCYRQAGATKEELKRASTLIKAAYKGYYTRRVMKRFLKDTQVPAAHEKGYVPEGDEETLAPERSSSWNVQQTEKYRQARAAIIIQRSFRQYIAKKLKMKSDSILDESAVSLESPDTTGLNEFGKSNSKMLTPKEEYPQESLTRYEETEGFHQMVEEIRLSTMEMSEAFEHFGPSEAQSGAAEGTIPLNESSYESAE